MITLSNIYHKVVLGVGAVIAMLTVASCSEFLETPSKSKLSTENFYDKPANIDQNLVGIYGALKPFSKYYFVMSEFRSDNLFNTTEAKTNDQSDCAQFNSTGLLTNSIVASCWADHYTLIAAANVLLDRMDGAGLDGAVATQYAAEARFLRALSYFDLVRFFGRVPISLHEIGPSEAFNIPQSEAIEVYEQAILPDLQYAVEHLQETATDYLGKEHKERVSRKAAKALLGKVYMQLAGYPFYQDTKAEAQALFTDVLATYTVNWAPTMKEWEEMRLHENDNKYYLFEIQYVAEKGQGNPATPYSKGGNTYADEYCGANLTAGSHIYVERDLQEHFLESNTIDNGDGTTTEEYIDKRLWGTVNTGLTYDEETGEYIGGATDQNNFCVKMFENKVKRGRLKYADMDADIVDRTCWPQNWSVLRIEDIMLLQAELLGSSASNIDSNGNNGYFYLNLIRERAGLNALNTLPEEAYQQAVANERRYELIGEGHRWFDQVRQNTFVNDLQTMFINYRDKRDASHSSTYTIYANRLSQNSALYPIPQSQIRIREGLYTQNPGY